ncbi:polysaccharide deacetylase family protein [Ochrobactrum sp. S1502_03]|uniref:polysaccharide deacetylase family protein n=1 Tax=Ochrobactrum sp. S1502_03 TaxID=3108451 RepID=UPI00320BEAB2
MAVPVLLYHQIAALPQRRVPYQGLFVHPDSFRRQMLCLKYLGYKGLSVRDAWPYLRGKKQGKVVVITFDDGFLNTLENAAPVLADCGFTSTNYFVANQIGGSNIWDREDGIPDTPCMNMLQMREWDALGHEVGAHTLDHVLLPETDDPEARRQIAESKLKLEDMLGKPITNFCYPYGGNNPIHREMVRDAGYESAVTTVSRSAKPDDDIYGIPRLYIRYRHSTFEALLRIMLK